MNREPLIPRTPFASGIFVAAICIVAPVQAARSPALEAPPPPPALTGARARAPVDTGGAPYTAADVHFMSGMILHHAQALLMAGWAPTHGASASVRSLCERIVVGQRDEIVLMRHWLSAHHEAAPEVDPSHMMMPGMDPSMLMPGMLTAEQLGELERAHGRAFDRVFLRYMIQHHQGAITMVNQLFAARAAGEEETVFRFAANVFADQTTEIERMQRMLADLLFEQTN